MRGHRRTGTDDRRDSCAMHFDMELLKMVPSLPYDGPFLEKKHLLPWINGVWWKSLKVCLFLLNELLSTLGGGILFCKLLEKMRKKGICHHPLDTNAAGMENRNTEFHTRNCVSQLQYTGGVDPLLPHYIPLGDRSMAEEKLTVERDCKMDTWLEEQSEMAFNCTTPLVLTMIWPNNEEKARSSDRADEDEENMDDAESIDWSTDDSNDESCDESDSHLLWDSFFQRDPYNPLNFSATTGPQGLTCKTDTEEDAEDSALNRFTPEESDNDELWDSFSQSTDPFNPLNFSACTTTSEPSNQGVKQGSVLSEEGQPDTPALCYNTDPSGVDQITPTVKQETSGNQRKTTKKVRFCPVVKVHWMIVWDFASRAARKGPWEQHARDRNRFQRRIANTEAAIGFCLDPKHRLAVWTKCQEPEYSQYYWRETRTENADSLSHPKH
ncbi:protein phosphatase 1 regulatory subunit 15B-like [Rhinoraja longicauda]